MNAKLTPRKIKEIFDYDSATGQLFWKIRAARNVKAGDATGTPTGRGYLGSKFCGKGYRTHKLIFAWWYGRWPIGEIDHINGVKTDNRISNLRDVTPGENCKNRRLNKNNTSGYIGVVWHENKWQAQAQVDNKTIYLGRFTSLSDAIKARKAAEVKFGFHKNHGSILAAVG